MKNIRKMMALALAMVMVLAMGVTVFAAPQTVHGTNVATNKGSITISNATVGKKYGLYKLFDATVALNADGTAKLGTDGKPIINYTVPTGKTLPADNTWFQVDANGNVSAKAGADITTEAFKTWAESFGIRVQEDVEATDSSLTFDQLEFGYYFITSEVGAVLTIDSTTPSATVIDKNQTVSFEKDIIENDQKVKVNEAGLKEDVKFQIETKATNYDGTDKIFQYVILDNLEAGMTYKAAPTVKVDGTAVTPASITYKKADGTATTTLSEAQSFEIIINWTEDGTKDTEHKYGANATILVEYNAFLDPTKADEIVIGGTNDGNTNTAQVKWFKGNDNPEEDEPSGKPPEKKTDTFTTELTILKVDQDGNALQGAEFTLTGPTGTVVITKEDTFTKDASGEYWLLKDGTYTTQDPNGTIDGNPVDKTKYASETDKYAKTTSTVVKGAGQTDTDIKVEVGTDGKAKFTGLGAGEYTLSETKVPAGYNKIADISFEITATVSDDTTSQTGKKITFATDNSDIHVESDNTLTLTVENQKGTELPSTGGIGTTIFYVIGAILVLGAGILLVTRRKVNDR
jgi:LPXTG-motif cell wall-anchored protein